MKISLNTVKFVSSFIILHVGIFGEKLENYDHELSTIKLLYYRPTTHGIDDPIEITAENASTQLDTKEVKVLIHGWNADAEHVAMVPVKNAYLRMNSSHVLMADWRDVAALRYFIARDRISQVGKRICQLLKTFMAQSNTTSDQIHVIGHSLGAHVGTHVGRCFKGANERLDRLTALDPAGPLFTPFSIDALNRNDFLFVDTIHTSAGIAGEFEIRGHVDSFPNRGIAPQPGCEKLDVLTVTACSHYRAPVFFAESILIPDSFPAYQCELSLIQSSKYRNCLNGSNVVSMGEHIDRNARGVYYFETYSSFPYGRSP